MNRSLVLVFIALSSIYFSGCGNKTTINENEASDVISNYLENNPEYKTVSFNFGELKFRGHKDQEELGKYKELKDKGYIEMNLQEQKKVFLSSDTSYVYLISLTEKAAPFVLSQAKDKAKIKAIYYILDEAKPVNFVKTNNKTAKATVSLKKIVTDFYPFIESKDSSSDFITKTYKLKLKKEAGWVIEGD